MKIEKVRTDVFSKPKNTEYFKDSFVMQYNENLANV